MTVRLLTGDMRERLAELEAESVDSCVTDPPYHLTNSGRRVPPPEVEGSPFSRHRMGVNGDPKASRGFMGQEWDGGDVAFQRATWEAVFRVLKPGSHLIAFSGTRTYHRMVCAIEDAGFEIRDQLAWIYGSGFPKSHDVSKGIDRMLGGEREIIGTDHLRLARLRNQLDGSISTGGQWEHGPRDVSITIPATPEAEQWQGWGTALKPSQEPVCLARKPWTNEQEWVTIRSLVEGLWSALWWMLPASDAVKDSALNPRACGVGLRASVQWSAERLSNIRADLSALMDMSQFELALISSLNTASSWNATLAAVCRAENTSTTETATSPTTDLRTLKSCLSRITPESIILAHRLGAWSSAHACSAGRYLNATLATFAATRELSALERAGDLAAIGSPDAVEISPNWSPICLARKPLNGTVARNVLKHGTGALNIAACRINPESTFQDGARNSPDDSRGGTSLLHGACPRCRNASTGQAGGSEPEHGDRNDPLASASVRAHADRQPLGSRGGCPTCPRCGDALAHASAAGGQASLLRSLDADSVRALREGRGRSLEPLSKPSKNHTARHVEKQGRAVDFGGDWYRSDEDPLGRWPANIIHDGSEEVLAGFPEESRSGGNVISPPSPKTAGIYGEYSRDGQRWHGHADSGSAARFFYCAKATSAERGDGNSHPTVKPVDLMRWLCRLVTPKGGTVLDPFAGSGSTLIAADAEQFNAIGCELSPEYAAIAERRIHASAGMFADVRAA